MLDRTESENLLAPDRATAPERNSEGIEALRQENLRLKNLLVTITASVLKSIVEANRRSGQRLPVECGMLFEKAEECFLAAQAEVSHGVAENLEEAGRALLAGAIELRKVEER